MKPDYISNKEWQLALQKYREEELLEKINNHYPIQYLIGNVEFLNTLIKVDERVLIPRYETELLVEKTMNRIKKIKKDTIKILELGTGSGCISIALKKNIPCEVTSIDISKEALDLALENAKQNDVVIQFIKEDMIETNYQGYDIIISNPPYVDKKETVGLETKYEPLEAIFAKNNGLYYYEEIIKKIAKEEINLKLIAFEMGINQGEQIKILTKTYLPNYKCEIEKDLTNRDRYAFITKIE